VRTSLAVRNVISSRLKTGSVIMVGVAAVITTLGLSGSASATATPTVAQVQKKLARLTHEQNKLGQQYDQILQQLAQANQRLKILGKETARYQATFNAMHQQIAQLAAIAYEEGGEDSPIGLLTSSSPQRVLSQSTILSELSVADGAQIRQYIAASRQLVTAEDLATRVKAGIVLIKRSLRKRIAKLKSLTNAQVTLLAQLSPAQQAGQVPGGGTSTIKYSGPTSSQADKAVKYVFDQLGCPYVYGGTGPCHSGYDCSGLMMMAWASAGVSIPRTSWDQMNSLPSVPLHTSGGAFTEKYLQPGDILGFIGNNHVGMYVGNGYLIDAPNPSTPIEHVQLSGWYLQNLDGAVRP
jgi:peptidoglycan DL-endopeptidase CwlO